MTASFHVRLVAFLKALSRAAAVGVILGGGLVLLWRPSPGRC
jgi:hypothetical protein